MSNCSASYIEQFISTNHAKVSHPVMIRAEHNKVVDIVASAPPSRNDVVNVNYCIPTAYHTFFAEVLGCIDARCRRVVCPLKVWVFVPRYILGEIFDFLAEPAGESAGSTAILGAFQSVRFAVIRLAAILTDGVLVFLISKCAVFCDGVRVRFVGAFTAAKMMWRLEVLIALFFEVFAAVFARYGNLFRRRILFGVLALVFVIALFGAKNTSPVIGYQPKVFTALSAYAATVGFATVVTHVSQVAGAAAKSIAFAIVFLFAPFACFHFHPHTCVFGVDCSIIPQVYDGD